MSLRNILVVGCAASIVLWGNASAMVLLLPPRSSSNGRVIVAPSVAKAHPLTLGADLADCVDGGGGGAEWLHFSVQDGRMVPKISYGAAVVAACRAAYPHTVLDVKLGVVEPEHRLADFVNAGADILSVHPEATLQLGAVLHAIGKAGVAPGVVLNPGTPVAAVEHVLDDCRVAVVMLVNPGYGGPQYVKQALAKIRLLRSMQPELYITVDGGVTLDTAEAFVAAGANVLVAGGGIFAAADRGAAIRALRARAVAGTVPSASGGGNNQTQSGH